MWYNLVQALLIRPVLSEVIWSMHNDIGKYMRDANFS